MDAFLMKAKAAEECASALIRGPGYCSHPLASKLDERIPHYRPHTLKGSPAWILSNEANLYVWKPEVVKHRNRSQITVSNNADGAAQSKIRNAYTISCPFR